jgi:cytochrome P450
MAGGYGCPPTPLVTVRPGLSADAWLSRRRATLPATVRMLPLGQCESTNGASSRAAACEPPVAQVDLGEFSRDLFHNIRALHDEFGPLGIIQDGGQRVAFLFSPELNQQVLSDTTRYQARFFAIRGPKNSAQRRLTGGLLSMNGQQHRRNRRLVKEPFSRRAISTYSEAILRLTDEMLATWRPGEERDVAEEMRRYMLQVTSTLLFGLDEPELALRLGDMLAEWVGMNDELGAGALVPNETFSKRYEELLAYADRLEAEILRMIRRRRESNELGADVLSILVRTHDEEGGLSDEELVGQAAVLFGAAHMTTAHSLSWTLFLLGEHPTVMQRLWDEWQQEGANVAAISSSSPEGSAWGDADSNGGGDETLSLLERVIKESMRVLPASAYSQRINVEAVELGPYRLPRGTGIVFTPLVTHRLPQVYADPKRFVPDRWLTLRPSPYAYHPFGAGARMCIGGPLALVIMRVALRRILSRFRLAVVEGAEISAHVESTMLVPTHGVRMIVHPADTCFASAPVRGNIHELVDLVEVGNAADGNGHVPTPRRPR